MFKQNTVFVFAAPRLAAKAMPDSKDVVAGATIPTTKFGVPQGSISPYWVMLTSSPFVFPTMSPWFIIPGKRDGFKLISTEILLCLLIAW